MTIPGQSGWWRIIIGPGWVISPRLARGVGCVLRSGVVRPKEAFGHLAHQMLARTGQPTWQALGILNLGKEFGDFPGPFEVFWTLNLNLPFSPPSPRLLPSDQELQVRKVLQTHKFCVGGCYFMLSGETLFFHFSGLDIIWRKGFDKRYFHKRANGEVKNIFHTSGQLTL